MKKGLFFLALLLAACAPLRPAGTPTETAASLPTLQPTPTRKPVRHGLHASNPATVDLHDGQIKFVEFFAFW